MDEDHNGNRETDWNAWAMPARRTPGASGPLSPAPPPPPPPGAPGHWGSPPPPPPYPGYSGAPSPYGPSPYGPSSYPGGWGAPHGGWGAPTTRTNGLAIASMVCGLLWLYWLGSILALVFGYVAKSQIDRSHGSETGRGMATAGIVLGWVGIGFLALFVMLAVLGAATSDPGPANSF